MLAGSERNEKLNLYSASDDATFSGESATEPAGRTNHGQTEFEPGHTAAEFNARHIMVTWVRGLFKDVHGRVTRPRPWTRSTWASGRRATGWTASTRGPCTGSGSRPPPDQTAKPQCELERPARQGRSGGQRRGLCCYRVDALLEEDPCRGLTAWTLGAERAASPTISDSTMATPPRRAPAACHPRRIALEHAFDREPLTFVARPTGIRIRTRLRLTAADHAVVEAVGVYLGRLAGADLASRCRLGSVNEQRATRKRTSDQPIVQPLGGVDHADLERSMERWWPTWPTVGSGCAAPAERSRRGWRSRLDTNKPWCAAMRPGPSGLPSSVDCNTCRLRWPRSSDG